MPRFVDTIQRVPRRASVVAPPLRPKKGRRMLWGVTVGVFTMAGVLMVLPLVPDLPLTFEQLKEGAPVSGSLTLLPGSTVSAHESGGSLGVLRIPNLDITVALEPNEKAAHGTAAWPATTGTGFAAQNTVLAAHRYTYHWGKGPFYRLPDIKLGDTFTIEQSGVTTTYKVTNTFTVWGTDLSVLKQGASKQITLLTCADLVSALKRFVVVAVPVP